jgi:hypothetical protein
VGLVDADHIVLSPEEFNLLDSQETILVIKTWEMKDDKIIIIINIDLGSLVGRSAVFDIQGVEVEVILQVLQVYFRRAYNVVPPKGTYFYRINHKCAGLKDDDYAIYSTFQWDLESEAAKIRKDSEMYYAFI